MKLGSSRRNFLAGLALPAAGMGTSTTASGPLSRPVFQPVAAGPELRYRVLGKTGLKVTSVAFGCMITSDASVIEKAADLGINHFDTARGYQSGNNERMVGAAIKAKRKQIVLSSKTGARTKSEALEHLNTSLKELGTDWLDIWYLHAKSQPGQLTDELIEAQQIAKKEGKIRFAGVSTHGGQAELVPAIIGKKVFDVLLTSYNFSMDPSMEPLIESAAKAGMGVVAMKVMAGGYRRVKPGDKLHETFQREGAMVAALKWVLRNQNIHTAIPSITDMEQLDENLKAMTSPLSSADEKLLARHLEFIGPMYCRMCGRCEGTCSQGLPVADVLRHLTYAEGYGQFSLGRESFLALPAAATGVRCSQCPSCTVRCPNGVHVTERLVRAQELFA